MHISLIEGEAGGADSVAPSSTSTSASSTPCLSSSTTSWNWMKIIIRITIIALPRRKTCTTNQHELVLWVRIIHLHPQHQPHWRFTCQCRGQTASFVTSAQFEAWLWRMSGIASQSLQCALSRRKTVSELLPKREGNGTKQTTYIDFELDGRQMSWQITM